MRRITILALLVLAAAPPPAASADGAPPDLARFAAIASPLEAPALAIPPVELPTPIDGILGGDEPPGDDCGGEADAGEDPDEAMAIPLPTDCVGSLGAGDDVDVYVVDAPARHRLAVDVAAPEGAAFGACVATPARVYVRCSFGGDVSLVTDEAGAWSVAVVRIGGEGAYGLRIGAGPMPPEAADCGGAPGANAAVDAAPLGVPFGCDGSTRFLDDVHDWYRIDAEAVRVTGTASAPTLACLFLADDALHPLSCALLGSDAAYAHAPGHGGYLLLVHSLDDATHHVEVELADAQDDCDAGHDAPGNLFLGVVLEGTPCAGALTVADAADVFVLRVAQGQALAVTATFDPGVDAMVCVMPLATAPFEPTHCEVAWAGGGGVAVSGAPAGAERDVLVATVAVGDTPYALAFDAHAPAPQDDCASGADASSDPAKAPPLALRLDCEGALLARDGDAWDVYRVELTEGPVYAELFALLDADLCLVDASFTQGACSSAGDLALSWEAGPAYVVVVRSGGSGTYRLQVEQQDDCGTGGDALPSGAEVASSLFRCEAVLDTFVGDAEDAFLVPPPLVPDVVVVRIEPMRPRVQLCVDDEVRQSGLRGRCTDATFSRILVARDPLRPFRITVAGFVTDPFGYTLIVEDPREHPPQVPPLL